MLEDIAIYGGSFNPPGVHHRRIVEELRRHFPKVIVVPCGPRPDKPSTDGVAPVYRAAMTDIAFRGIEGVDVDLFDLEEATFTRTHALQERYAALGKVWHVVGSDLVAGGDRGESFIHRRWQHGPALWEQLNFAIVRRPGFDVNPADLPRRHRMIDADAEGSSFAVRERLFRGETIDGQLPCDVRDFIARHKLYHGTLPSRAMQIALKEPRFLIFADTRNPKAAQWAESFARYSRPDDPNCVLVIGGDGTMLRAIQQHWRLRVPFFGLNAGHLGFLLNNASEVLNSSFPAELVVRHMPLLYVEMELRNGEVEKGLTFNDAWVERSTGQTAWLSVTVDGCERLPKLVCDGLLVATAAGSTAYARSMGATPLLADTPAWMVVGSNVMDPINWKSALLSLDARLEMRSLDPVKRPLNGYMFGAAIGEVVAMRARISRVAAVELAFCPSHDITEKISDIQFLSSRVNAPASP
jgi:nicotinate (nicotinamide) nucleotide adenylyltransferase